MNPELKILIFEERKILVNLLTMLDKQYDLIINKEIMKVDKVAKDLDEIAKNLAKTEIRRRSLMGKDTKMKTIIDNCSDENIKQAYEEIKNTLKMIEIQKEANNTLIKHRLFFTKKMIDAVKPNKSMNTYNVNTYNAYGQLGK